MWSHVWVLMGELFVRWQYLQKFGTGGIDGQIKGVVCPEMDLRINGKLFIWQIAFQGNVEMMNFSVNDTGASGWRFGEKLAESLTHSFKQNKICMFNNSNRWTTKFLN